MVHSPARHGLFDYLTESFRVSQNDALQSHPNSEVKIRVFKIFDQNKEENMEFCKQLAKFS